MMCQCSAQPDLVAKKTAKSCRTARAKPAWITKGDARARYEQAMGPTKPVKSEWITGWAWLVVDKRDGTCGWCADGVFFIYS